MGSKGKDDQGPSLHPAGPVPDPTLPLDGSPIQLVLVKIVRQLQVDRTDVGRQEVAVKGENAVCTQREMNRRVKIKGGRGR